MKLKDKNKNEDGDKTFWLAKQMGFSISGEKGDDEKVKMYQCLFLAMLTMWP